MIKYPLNVTLDTNVFEENKFDFGADSTMNLLIKNVQNGKIKVVLSNIVIKEVEKHICQRVDQVCGKARKLRKEYLEILPEQFLTDIGLETYVQIPNKKIIHQKAKDVFKNFLEECKVEILDTSRINLEEILEDYFAVQPPFENSEKKKKEFPDAFIAAEIRKRFDNNEVVAIVSKDNGFIKACKNSKNHLFFPSLGKLFDTLNKNEEEYTNAVELIKKNNDNIIQKVKRTIDDSCVEVHGLSYDGDGIIYGYDYDDTCLKCCYLNSIKLHTIDDIEEDTITASLWIHGNMDVDCYFDDLDNAIWDTEDKKYIYVNVRHILEKHRVCFACRIRLNRKTEEISLLPFKIVLGEDTRKESVEIDDDQEILYSELQDANREELGFLPLSKYDDFLEDNLNGSSMEKEMLELFEQYNEISSCYEELANMYDEINNKIKYEMEEVDKKAFISALTSERKIPFDFSEKDTEKVLNKITTWLDKKIEMTSEMMERNLPGFIEYGEKISIFDQNRNVYVLSFGELHGIPNAGSEELIEISLSLDEEILAKGYVKLTVGYLNFDEDGGASDGIRDSIDYDVDEVLNALENLVLDLKGDLNSEIKLAVYIESCLKQTKK